MNLIIIAVAVVCLAFLSGARMRMRHGRAPGRRGTGPVWDAGPGSVTLPGLPRRTQALSSPACPACMPPGAGDCLSGVRG